MKSIPSILLNKYVLTIAGFLVWMIFFDQKDFFYTSDHRHELKKVQETKAYYVEEIAKEKQKLIDFQGNRLAIEKYGRERYMLKKDGEDLYLVEDSLTTKR
jgi:cell division protein DivIC